MKLSRVKVITSLIICALILTFSYQYLIFAQQSGSKVPIELADLLTGKTSDFSSAIQLPENKLPIALSVVKLLKFKALHQEIPIPLDEINRFEAAVMTKIEESSVVSFSQTNNCHQKIEQSEINIAGQKLIVPEYFISDSTLVVTSVIPSGEAGSIFPAIQITLFSRAPLTDYSLSIDGNEISSTLIKSFQETDEFTLIFQPELSSESLLFIGTHAATITATNELGEQTRKDWAFTVGLYDQPSDPLPDGSTPIKELQIAPGKILPGQKISGRLSVVIYQDKTGKAHTVYKLVTSSGQVITSRNLAFIGRKLTTDRDDADELSVSPKTHLAFAGNTFNFTYTYSGSGKVLSDRWHIRNGSTESTESSATMVGDIDVTCIAIIEKTGVDADGNPITYQYEISETRHIGRVSVTERIFHDRRMLISNETSCSIPVAGEVWLWLDNTVHEGKKYTLDSGELTVDKLRWKVQAAENSPTIKNPVATITQILFSEHGFAELAFDIKMTYRELGETYESNFKPEVSGLYAFYPVEGKAVFSKFPRAQISVARRYLGLKSFEFTIKKQKRLISSPSDFELSEPVLICKSSIWPASSPIKITRALPVISKGHSNNFLDAVDPFTFITPMAVDEDEIPLSLFGRFFFDQEASLINPTLVSDLESIPVFEAEDLIELQLSPSELVTIQEGQQTEFEAQLAPVHDYGTGLYSATDESLNVLDGYTISSVENILWFEEPLWGDDEEEDWKKKAARTLDFLHVFDPFVGVGSYSMNCGFIMNIQESDTKDEVPAFIFNATPVNVLPGLRILSPIDKLAYPLNQTIKVKTTLDDEEFLTQWQNIKWKLNDKEFKPEGDKPPFEIELNKPGKWKLEAELKTEDPVTGEELILKDTANFEVKPIGISLIPSQKVINLNAQSSTPLRLSVVIDGNEVENPEKPVIWQEDELQAIIDPVEWFMASKPDGCASADLDPKSFDAELQFYKTGAATVLATVTVRLVGAEELFKRKHKGFKDEYEEPVFTFPVVRADSWAVIVGKLDNIKKHFPNKSIAQAYRTYDIASFSFEFSSSTREPHSFNKENGLQPPIILKSALPSDFESISADIGFKWNITPDPASVIIEQVLVEPSELVIKPSEPCNYNVSAEVNLDFDQSTKIKLGDISITARAVDLFSLIETKVDPSSFTVAIGEPKQLKYIVSSIEIDPPLTKASGDSESDENIIYLLNNSYALSIKQVLWSYEQDSPPSAPVKNSIEINPYEFSSNAPGKIEGQANGKLKVEELKSLKTADFDAIANFSGYISEEPIQILINGKPLGSENYHMGQKIVLSYKVEPDNLENVSWSLEGPLPFKSLMNRASGDLATHTVNNFEVEFLVEENLKEKQIEFYLFDFNSEKIVKNGSFTYKIADTEYVKKFEISYLRPYLKNVDITPLEQIQRIDVKLKTIGSQSLYVFGFVNENEYGILATGEFENKTAITYRVGAFQLIKIDGTRPFNKIEDEIASNPKTIIQVKKTINASAPVLTEPVFWLDTNPPQDDGAQTSLIEPGENKTIELANDIPSIGLLDQWKQNGSTYNAINCQMGQDFLVYVYAKPIDKNGENIFEYYKSIWFPLAIYKWRWSGLATHYSSLHEWDTNPFDNPRSNLRKSELKEFPYWSDFTQTGSSKPEWRDYLNE